MYVAQVYENGMVLMIFVDTHVQYVNATDCRQYLITCMFIDTILVGGHPLCDFHTHCAAQVAKPDSSLVSWCCEGLRGGIFQMMMMKYHLTFRLNNAKIWSSLRKTSMFISRKEREPAIHFDEKKHDRTSSKNWHETPQD